MKIKKIANSKISMLAALILLFFLSYDVNDVFLASLGFVIGSLLISSIPVLVINYFISLDTKEKIFYTFVVAIVNQILLLTPLGFMVSIFLWISLIALIILFVADIFGVNVIKRKQ